MEYSTTFHNGYCIVSITRQLSMLSRIDFLKAAVKKTLKRGTKRIAVRFPDRSFLSSRSIAVLIACNEMVQEVNGDFLIVGGGEELLSYLDSLGIKDKFSFCRPSDKVLAPI